MGDPSRHNAILDIARRLFVHYGLQKTTIADVAREAGVGVGTVYLEFPSKDALVEELSRRQYEGILNAMRQALRAPGLSASERLERALNARTQSFLELNSAATHACDLLHCGLGAVRQAHDVYRAEEHGLVRNIVEEGKTSGEFTVEDPGEAARLVLLAYLSFGPPMVFKADPERAKTDLAMMHGLVLRGLLRR
ncbi:MAG: TetR/AcrR family transcriptional regulator [Polyangiaceae bacterium]|nr:TetR/AcrR family transcriptional regulator [Polyangiaceae bacterium]